MPVARDEDQHQLAAHSMALLAKLSLSELAEADNGIEGARARDTADLDTLEHDLDRLQDAIATLMTRVYEIQEIRHAPLTGMNLDDKLQSLDATLESLSKTLLRVTNAVDAVPAVDAEERDLRARLDGVEQAWRDAVDEDAVLREELREDRWLVVFRTAAEQADSMVDSLQKAINQCTDFIRAVGLANGREDVSLEAFLAVEKSYAAKKKFYVPSVTKSLSILDKGIRERVTKNGETLRRHSEMKQRWNETASRLAALDAQLPLIKHKLEGLPGLAPVTLGTQEMLTSPVLSSLSLSDDPSTPSRRAPRSRAPSVGSSRSDGSLRLRTPGRIPPAHSPDHAHNPLRRQPSSSAISDVSAAGGSRPRWNSSPKVLNDPGPAYSPTVTAAIKHSTSKHLQSLYSVFGGSRRASSPGASSTTSTIDSSRPPSKIPVPSPRRVVSSPSRRPHLSLSRSSDAIPPVPPLPPGLASPPAHSIKGLERANAAYLRSSMMTPEPVLRQRATLMPFYTSSRPSSAANTTPARSRPSLGAGSKTPPSSYRAMTPTGSRAGAATPSMDRPKAFIPNPLDQLDLEIAKLLAAHPGELTVHRTDPPLRANQLRAGHEWKGEYIFGQGKVVQCRLLELARSTKAGGKSRKVMVRVGGVWIDLSTYLAKLG